MSEERIPEAEPSETGSPSEPLKWQQVWPPLSYWSKASLVIISVVITVRILAVLQNLLLIVVAAFVISLGLQPAIKWMEQRGLKRGAAMALMLLLALAAATGAGLAVLPVISSKPRRRSKEFLRLSSPCKIVPESLATWPRGLISAEALE